MNRRNFVLSASAALLPFKVYAQSTAAYPTKPVKIIVGFPAGQATDIIARIVSEKLAPRLGQPLVVENKPGAGGGVALGYLAQQTPDGYNVSFANTGAVITNQFLQKDLPYRREQLLPVALLGDVPLVLAAKQGGKIRSLKDLIEQARANPGKLTYATPGNGTTSHLAMESLKQAANIDLLHIPYTGSSRALTDLIAGNVDVSFDTVTTIFPFTESNRLTPIAIGSATRIKSLPNVPTLAELGYRDIIGSVWIGVFVQRGTPATVVKKLEAELERVVRDPETSQRLEIAGLYARYADSAGYADILVKDTAEIEKVVRFSGLQPS